MVKFEFRLLLANVSHAPEMIVGLGGERRRNRRLPTGSYAIAAKCCDRNPRLASLSGYAIISGSRKRAVVAQLVEQLIRNQ